jgi:hypothetical protein
LKQVQDALGIAVPTSEIPAEMPVKQHKTFNVLMRFASPAWDEKDGIPFPGIKAKSKSDANRVARRLAERDGHAIRGVGRYTFTATEAE